MRSAKETAVSDDHDEEQGPLEVGRMRESLRERNGEQEREQHLHARQRDAQLVEQLDQLAANTLAVVLVRTATASHPWVTHGSLLSRRCGT
jgi:hypothetical protein